MIRKTKNKLILTFSIVITGLSVIIMGIGYVDMKQSVILSYQTQISTSEKFELTNRFNSTVLEEIGNIDEDDFFEVINAEGEIVQKILSEIVFAPPVDRKLVQLALEGKESFRIIEEGGEQFIFFYFKLNEKFVGRTGVLMTHLTLYENNFIRSMIYFLPGIIVLSIFVSYVLVSFAMKPVIRAFRFQENFSSNVSHELHTPLTTLKGNLELALRKKRDANEYRQMISSGLAETNKIIKLLDVLNLLASSEIKPLEFIKKPINLKQVVCTLLEQEKDFAILDKISFHSNTPVEQLDWLGDELLISRAFFNLIENAIKYSVPDSIISIDLEYIHPHILFTVSNRSDILDLAEVNHLTEAFFRSKYAQERKIAGKGLGLNIASYIIYSHLGNLSIDYSNKIFTVTCTLPKGTKYSNLVTKWRK
ncbi:MAG: GHKL domain-containing protein [SAR324 cluster bacterium]|nr:GHKL domain-containing protein [SAR324 cluster bacterium]